MEGNEKKWLIVLIIILSILFGINIYKNTPNFKIKKYLLNRGFYLEDDGTFYYKQLSENTISEYEDDRNKNKKSNYDYLYFNQYDRSLIEVINEYEDKYESSLNINYNFSNNKVKYTYRIDYEKTNIIIKGTYDELSDELTCKKEYAHNINLDDNKDFCDNASLYIRSFYEIKNKIFTNKKINKYLQK